MKSLKGHLLLASANLLDPNFRRSILLIVQHDDNGAMGLVLNRPTRMTIAQAWSQISENPCQIEAPLFQGGPCEGPLIVLHSRESMAQIPVMDGIYCSTDAQNVSWLVENTIDPVKFFVGYAGWEAGQLENELGESAWMIAPANSDTVFQTHQDAWSILMKRLTTTLRFPDINPNLIPPDPSVNQSSTGAGKSMKDDHAQLLRTALEHHQAGRYAEAEALYQKALAQQPKDPEAVHGLGFLRFHQQRLPEAIELIQQAITLQPNQPRYHHNLAEAYRAGRQYEEAIAAYQQALKLRPYYPIALNNLGNTYLAMDRFDDAAIALRQAIGLQQQFPEAHYNLGLVYYGQNQPVEAAKCLYVALEQRPTYMKACHSLSTILQNLRRPEDAVACLFHALQMDPKNPALHNNLGIMHIELAHYDEAEKYLRQALELVPDMPEAHANLANMMRRLPAPESERKARGAARAEAERLQTILEHHEQALRVRPNYADSLAGYAVTLFCMPGRLQDAMAAAHNAVRINSDPKESIWSYWNLALLQLMHGDFENGWQAAEVRLKMPTIFAGFPSKQPVWDGSTSLKGKTLLVSSEQGLGDNIQMVRYVPILADMGASVVVQTRPQLVRLLQTVRGAAEVVSREEPLPEHDLQIPMMSLPHRFKTNLETIPHEVPYLRADPANTPARLREKKTGTFKVGLSWCGSPDNISNIYRSIRLAELSPLARIPGVEFYSLQKGPGEEEVAKLPAEFPVVNLSKEIEDLADTAASIMELDLVIAVDTAVAHLAGALGQPVWMLLYYPGEWRWLLDRKDSPWYPTMRIFRQKDRGDWEPLIREVAGELAKAISGR